MTPETVLPTDPFDLLLAKLTGLPNGAHTQPTVTQAVDFYGNVTQFIIQTVKTDEGATVFITQVNAAGRDRFILPQRVLALIDRQRGTATTQIRRRHGKRLAEERGSAPVFTPEMRRKALETRKRNAAERKRKAVRS